MIIAHRQGILASLRRDALWFIISLMETAQKDLIEVRFHARAGQGAKAAAHILAQAGLKAGKHIQAFPQYGPERRGAPVTSFVRLSSNPITLHSDITEPDYVVVLEPQLLSTEDVIIGISKGTRVIINSPRFLTLDKDVWESLSLYLVDATKIARHFLNNRFANVIMLGALLKISDLFPLSNLEQTLKEEMGHQWTKEIAEKNYLGAKTAFSEVKEFVK